MTPWLMLAAVAAPLVAAVLATRPGARVHRWAPAALLPAAALAVAPAHEARLDWLLLGTTVGLDDTARVFLVLAAAVWAAALVALRPVALRLDAGGGRFLAAALLTAAATVAAPLAQDVIAFYAAYAVMTLAAYPLVVPGASGRRRRAGRLYITMTMVGETLLLAGLVLAVARAGDPAMGAVRSALGEEGATAALALLVAGFGVKIGVLGVHGWLPLTYAAAPLPAAAALSGVVTEIGILGWLRTLPMGEAEVRGGAVLVGLGLAGAVYGAVAGLTQRTAGLALGYSSVSQMGLVTAAAGVALAAPEAAPAATAALLLFALHHGLTKAALFLSVGAVAAAVTARGRRLALAGFAAAAAALAGAPLTSGGLAKDALKGPAAAWQPWMEPALILTGAATAALMVRAGMLVARAHVPRATGVPAAAGLGLLLTAMAAVVVVAPRVGPLADVARPHLSPASAVVAALGAAAAWAALALLRARGRRPPAVPAGDVTLAATAAGGRAVGVTVRLALLTAAVPVVARRLAAALHPEPLLARIPGLEARLTTWAVGATLVVALAVGLAVAA